MHYSSSFELDVQPLLGRTRSWGRCWAAIRLSQIVQNRQAVQSIVRSMAWILEDNMVDGLFFCATLTGRRGDHTPFVQAGADMPHSGVEAVKPHPGFSWEGHSGRRGCRCRRGWKYGVLWGCPPTPYSNGDPPTAPHVCYCCQRNWWVVVRRVQMGVSI